MSIFTSDASTDIASTAFLMFVTLLAFLSFLIWFYNWRLVKTPVRKWTAGFKWTAALHTSVFGMAVLAGVFGNNTWLLNIWSNWCRAHVMGMLLWIGILKARDYRNNGG